LVALVSVLTVAVPVMTKIFVTPTAKPSLAFVEFEDGGGIRLTVANSGDAAMAFRSASVVAGNGSAVRASIKTDTGGFVVKSGDIALVTISPSQFTDPVIAARQARELNNMVYLAGLPVCRLFLEIVDTNNKEYNPVISIDYARCKTFAISGILANSQLHLNDPPVIAAPGLAPADRH